MIRSLGFRVFAMTFATALLSFNAFAAVKSETVEYKDGKAELEGFMAYDDSAKTPRPAVLIVHQWMGITDHEKDHARILAAQGYVAFALDVYGKGFRPTNVNEAGTLSGKYKEDRKLLRSREMAAYNLVKKDKRVDPKHIVVIGYCFGGLGALELGRFGAALAGIASFHGALSNPNPLDAKNIKSPVLVMHGALDPYVKKDEVDAFVKEMNDAKVDYEFISYSNAVHAFTQKMAGNNPSAGVAYNERADRRSWATFMEFLKEVAPIK
ncbi:dienelactone hydrolase family protein [Bdellovibrio svalbardensis]|uniref:Dienelactone hydrolase family protein n=1 Tax=Bdellovibrio svalbardensis TaxID=2972972 RepID=A0ABT6DMI0_9BACT|nr:dienelactone hydrolase family protein [Bdellovibrio svalbardensis]MDG0818008.1 dienelactone hydrolase family protein [Bdellovibrio svalbardensis]